MKWNNHYKLEGQHAILSASQSSWLRYDEAKLKDIYENLKAKELGTRIHAWAAEAIGYGMDPEVLLYYSDYCFGTADAISFRNNFLRIHDLKTGKHDAKFEQLRVYAALFCLEYGHDPKDIQMELRIYQNDEVRIDIPEPEIIVEIMKKIISLDNLLHKYSEEEY